MPADAVTVARERQALMALRAAMRTWTRRAFVTCAAIIACACAGSPPEPPGPTPAMDSWSKYQNDLAAYFDKILGRPNNMRVVPAALIYPIGTVVRRDSVSEISKKCVFETDSPPTPVNGPDVPSVTAVRKFKIGADPGSLISNWINELDSLRLGYERGADLTSNITEVTTRLLAEDEVLSVLQNPACLAAVESKEVSVVRGYVSARYQVSAGGGVDAGAAVTVVKAKLIDINYQNENKFEMREDKAAEKFAILADGRVERSVVLSGGFLKETDSGLAGCSEKLIIKFESNRKRTDGSDTSSKNFSSCEDLRHYVNETCTNPSSQECKDLLRKLSLEAAGFKE